MQAFDAARRLGGAASLGLVLTLAATGASAPEVTRHPLETLAESLAQGIREVATGRDVALGRVDDGSGRGLGTDLGALLRRRLGATGGPGPAVVVAVAVAETPEKLIASARLTDARSGELLGLLSASASVDPARLDLAALHRPATRRFVDVVARSMSAPLPEPVLDLAWIGDRLLLLSTTRVRLASLDGARVEIEGERELPAPTRPTRAPAGLLVPGEGEAVWALTNVRDLAVLVVYREGGLELRARSQTPPAIPGLGLLRYREGTNRLDASDAAPLAAAGLLRVAPPLAVGPGGELLSLASGALEDTGARVGSALATLWERHILASTTAPPQASDAIEVRRLADGEVVESIETPGAVGALATRARGDRADVVAAIDAYGGCRLLVVELARRVESDLPEDGT